MTCFSRCLTASLSTLCLLFPSRRVPNSLPESYACASSPLCAASVKWSSTVQCSPDMYSATPPRPPSHKPFPFVCHVLVAHPDSTPPSRGASCALYGHLVERDKGNAAALCRLQLGETPASDSVTPNLVRTTIVPVVTMRSPSDL